MEAEYEMRMGQSQQKEYYISQRVRRKRRVTFRLGIALKMLPSQIKLQMVKTCMPNAYKRID